MTGDFIYARLMRAAEGEPTGYAPQDLDAWAERARVWAAGGEPADLPRIGPENAGASKQRECFVYFIERRENSQPSRRDGAAGAVAEPVKSVADCDLSRDTGPDMSGLRDLIRQADQKASVVISFIAGLFTLNRDAIGLVRDAMSGRAGVYVILEIALFLILFAAMASAFSAIVPGSTSGQPASCCGRTGAPQRTSPRSAEKTAALSAGPS